MIKQLLNSVIEKYRDFFFFEKKKYIYRDMLVSRRSIIWLSLPSVHR